MHEVSANKVMVVEPRMLKFARPFDMDSSAD